MNYSLDLNAGPSPCQNETPSLLPGESCTLQVAFVPSGTGTYEAGLDIASNALNSPTLTVPLTGTGWAPTVPWMALYGGNRFDAASSAAQTAEGGYVVVGATESFGAGGSDILVLRLHPDGTIAWQETFGSIRDDEVNGVITDDQGDIIIAGNRYSKTTGLLQAWILKLDSHGKKLWEKTYADQQDRSAQYIAPGQSGNIIVAGHRPWVMMLDSQGDIQWARSFGNEVALTSLQGTSAGGALIAVHKHDPDISNGFIYFMELDSSGNVLWCKKVFCPSINLCEAGSISEMGSGGYALSMKCLGPNAFWAAVLNSDRVLQWQYSNSWPSSFNLHLLALANDNLIMNLGSWLAKFADDGSLTWQVISPAVLKSIQQTRDGGYIVAGGMQDGADVDMMVAKLNTAGLVPGCDAWSPATVSPASINVELREALGITGTEMQFNVNDASWSQGEETNITASLVCLETPPDSDGDGISETEEKGPDGTDDAYDGNNDGQPDWQQDSVTSFHVPSGSYVTVASSDNIPLRDVSAVSNPAPVGAPQDVNFAYDFLS